MTRKASLAAALLALVLIATPTWAGSVQTGTASWYGPGTGVATQWCTWTLRHTAGCGSLAIQSADTGITVIAPVVDWCQCYRGTPDERMVDLQLGVVAALGLDPARGLYAVTTWPAGDGVTLPDAATDHPLTAGELALILAGLIVGWAIGSLLAVGIVTVWDRWRR